MTSNFETWLAENDIENIENYSVYAGGFPIIRIFTSFVGYWNLVIQTHHWIWILQNNHAAGNWNLYSACIVTLLETTIYFYQGIFESMIFLFPLVGYGIVPIQFWYKMLPSLKVSPWKESVSQNERIVSQVSHASVTAVAPPFCVFSGGLQVDFFISHHWAEDFGEFVQSVLHHGFVCWGFLVDWMKGCAAWRSSFQHIGIYYVYTHMGVSKNRGTPKWMVYNGKPY